MDPRIPYSEGNGVFSAFDGKHFSFNPSDKESKKKAKEKLEAYSLPLIKKLDEVAGREVTFRELIGVKGIKHPDSRGTTQKTQEKYERDLWRKSLEEDDDEEKNPYDDPEVREVMKGKRKKTSREERYEQLRKEWEEKNNPEAEPELPKAQKKAIADAERELFFLRFSPVEQREIERAEHRLEVARAGDLDRYNTLTKEWVQENQAIVDEQQAKLDDEISKLNQEKERLGSLTEPPSEPKYNADGNRVLSRKETLEFDRQRAEQE